MRRAQAISLDVVFAVSIFIVVLISTFWLWNFLNVRHQELVDHTSITASVDQAYDMLLYTTGSPSYWHTQENISLDDIEELGLRSSFYIDEAKVQDLNESNATHYGTFSRLLGLYGDIEGWELAYYDIGPSGFLEDATYTVGIAPSSTAQHIVVREHYGVNQDSQSIKIVMKVWQ